MDVSQEKKVVGNRTAGQERISFKHTAVVSFLFCFLMTSAPQTKQTPPYLNPYEDLTH